MKNTVKIFEELNKMKNLSHVKRGIVISEQDTGLDADIVAFRDEIVNNAGFANNVDEKKLVDILKKYATNKNTFQNFQDKFSEKYKYKPSEIMAKSLDMSNDSEEYDDLNNALEKIGLKYTNSGGIAKFEELSAIRQTVINANYCRVKNGKIEYPGTAYNGRDWSSYISGNKVTPEEIAAAKATCPSVIVPDVAPAASQSSSQTDTAVLRQKNINFNYCSVKNGKIENAKSGSNGMTWQNYVSTYKITSEEIAAAKATCPNVVVPDVLGAQTGPTPTQRLATTAKSLGVENPQLDVPTLQKILDTLNASSGAVTESKKSVNEELNMMKYLLGYQRGKVISEQDAPAATPQQLIQQIQTVLKTKYNANLGNYGPNKDGIDSKWGNLTQTALENALKTTAETQQKADELSQRRAAETQQTATQDTAIQQAVDQGSQNIMNANLQLQAANTQGVQAANTQGVQAANTQGVQAANTQGVQTSYLYTTLVNNKTLQTRNNGNQIVYKGDDLTPAQRQELESKLQTMGYILSTDDRDKRYGDKLIFKKK